MTLELQPIVEEPRPEPKISKKQALFLNGEKIGKYEAGETGYKGFVTLDFQQGYQVHTAFGWGHTMEDAFADAVKDAIKTRDKWSELIVKYTASEPPASV